MKNRYRIVQLEKYDYRIQCEYWWFPFCWINFAWGQSSEEEAEDALKLVLKYKNKPKFKSRVVKTFDDKDMSPGN